MKVRKLKKVKSIFGKFKSVPLIVLLCIGCGNFLYYGLTYYVQGNLEFREEDWFLFSLSFVSIAVSLGMGILFYLQNRKLTNALEMIYEAVVESEDGLVHLTRDTQQLIIKLNKSKMGGLENEEKLSVKTKS